MSVLDDYKKAKAKRKKEDESNNSVLADYREAKASQREPQSSVRPSSPYPTLGLDDDIAPIGSFRERVAAWTEGWERDEEEEEERRWFQSGSGNWVQQILGTATDALEEFYKGGVGIGEKVIDAGASLYPYISAGVRNIGDDRTYREILDEERAKADEFIERDIIDESEVAKQLLSVMPTVTRAITNPSSLLNPLSWQRTVREQQGISDYIEGDMEDNSVLGEKSEALVQSAGQLAAQYGLSMVGVPWFVTSGVTSYGGEMENALLQGATHEQAMGSAAITAGAEIIFEKLFNGDLFTKSAGSDLATKWLATNISNKALRTAMKLGMDVGGEGLEEAASDLLSNLGSALYREENIGEILFNEEALDGYLEAAIGGMVLGGGMTGIKVAQSAAKGKDYTTGLTQNEQAVVDKVYNDLLAEQEGEPTQKEKNKLYDEVVEALERGEISTETIESVLGRESYEAYDALKKEADEFSTLYNTEGGKLSEAQRDRLAELKAKNAETPYSDALLTAQRDLSENVMGLVGGDRLINSYNERGKRGQTFAADLTQYDEKQRETIQRAIDSGILNDTRRTHEFVDLIARISADTGVLFNFTDNAKLKESGFAMDGKTVNGFVSEDGVTVNINSKKALNTVVGHEITHVLEGTEFYDTLQETLFNYAVEKGEYYDRLKGLRETYQSVYSGEDFETKVKKELAADLVGEYLFTDSEFIGRLSTEHRNVFQKIYDELKHLLNLATAGSKEARELERVKKAFDEAYRAGGKETGETKYSMSDSDGRQFSEGQHSLSDEVTDAQNERGLDTKSEVQFSLTNDTAYMDKAISVNESMQRVTGTVLADAKTLRERIAARMTDIRDRGLVGLPEDIEGNTYIANSSYDGTEENTTICPRSLASEAFVDAVSEYLGRPLTVEEQIYISQDLQGRSMTPECTYCYVATDRKAYRAFLGEYIAQRDAVLQKLQESPDADVSRSGELYKEFLNGRKDTSPMYSRFKMWVDSYKNGKTMIQPSHLANMNKLMGDINSEFGAELKPQIVDAMKYAQSASWAKKRVNYVAYNGHILKWKQDRINKLNGHYGLRMYSFSDFHPAFVLENMQMITDASVRGLKMLGYTKDTDFVEIFAPSGMNINVSTFGFETGGNVYENNLIGAEWEKAKALRTQYPNVGITFVATNDTLVEWALEQDWIDVVIPYHLVRTGAEVAKAFNYTNYTSESADTKTTEWTKGKDKKYIAPTEHNNDKATYLAALEANHLKPRFERFIDNPNYMKLVNECRQPASQSKPVQPVFNEDAAMVALAKLEANGYYQPIGGSVDRMYEIAAEVAEDMTKALAPAMSLSNVGETFKEHGNYNVYGKDMAYAPVQETAPAPVVENATTEVLPDDLTPMDDDAERFASITDEDAPPEMEAPLYEDAIDNGTAQMAMWEEEQTEKPPTRKVLHRSIVDNVKARFAEKGFDLDNVLKKAKNLSTFATVDNTPQRVMEKALGYKEGGVLADLTVNQVAQNETEGIKWLNSFTDRKNGVLVQISKQYGIKPGSKESAAAQMYAEGFYVDENNDIIQYGDDELAKDFPDAKTQQNIKGLAGDPRIRQIYDDTLAMINVSRTRNAYPEIPRLDNYFLHFRAMEDTFSRLGLPFNPNDIRAKDLPTDLNGVTADLKPGQPYFASAMHRTGKRTSFDLLGGLEKYLTSAKNQIYHIDDIQTLRALRNYIADTYGQANGLEGLDELSEEEQQERIEQVYGSHLSTFAKFLNEEANVLAGKTALIDRGLEGIIGRRGITFLDTINKQVGSNMVGLNISSSLTNFLPVAQTFAKTNKVDFVKAFGQTVANKIGSIVGRGDDFAENSPVIIRRKGADRFYRTPYQKVGDVGYAFMSAVDDISTELIARTKYNELTRKGMDSQQAHFETDKWVSKLMGDRSLGQQPQLYNSKMLGMITKFQLEVRNQLDSQFYDTIQEAKASNEDIQNALERNAKTAAKVASTFVQLAVVQHLFGMAFESIAGYNPAFDIIEVIAKAIGWDDEEESEDTDLDNVEQAFLTLLEDLPYTSTFTGGRIPISSALPVEQFVTGKDEYGNEKSRWETLAEVAPYYLLPTGYGQGKKTVQGLGMFSDEHPVAGSYTDSGNLRFPVDETLGSKVQAAVFGQWSSKNAGEYFDGERKPLNEKQTQEYIDLDLPISEYWQLQDTYKRIAKEAEGVFASDKDILSAKYIASVDSDLSALQNAKESLELGLIPDGSEYDELREEYGKRLPSYVRDDLLEDIESRMDDLVNERADSYDDVTILRDGYAQVGGKYFKQDDDGDWSKMTDDQVTKYLAVSEAGDAHYATYGGMHYRLEEGGDWRNVSDWTKISDKQLERQNEVTQALGITPEEYWANTDISFIPMARGEYEYAYDNPENYAVASAVGGYDAYRTYSSELGEIHADKDENGRSISGSRKDKVIDYINSLDIDYGMRLILLKNEYNADDTYNSEIIDYLNSREDISDEDRITILKELGFDVDANGNITW